MDRYQAAYQYDRPHRYTEEDDVTFRENLLTYFFAVEVDKRDEKDIVWFLNHVNALPSSHNDSHKSGSVSDGSTNPFHRLSQEVIGHMLGMILTPHTSSEDLAVPLEIFHHQVLYVHVLVGMCVGGHVCWWASVCVGGHVCWWVCVLVGMCMCGGQVHVLVGMCIRWWACACVGGHVHTLVGMCVGGHVHTLVGMCMCWWACASLVGMCVGGHVHTLVGMCVGGHVRWWACVLVSICVLFILDEYREWPTALSLLQTRKLVGAELMRTAVPGEVGPYIPPVYRNMLRISATAVSGHMCGTML